MATMTSWLNRATPYLQGTQRLFNPSGLEGESNGIKLKLIRTGDFTGDIVGDGMPKAPFGVPPFPRPSAATFIELMVRLEQLVPEASVPIRLAIIDLFTKSLQ